MLLEMASCYKRQVEISSVSTSVSDIIDTGHCFMVVGQVKMKNVTIEIDFEVIKVSLKVKCNKLQVVSRDSCESGRK